jgi:hypothetical protein
MVEKVNQRRDAFEKEHVPDLFRLSQEARKLEKAGIEAGENLPKLLQEIDQTARKLCPELDYWLELRDRRRQLAQASLFLE